MSAESFALGSIVELIETRSRRTAQAYLDAGYRLVSAGVVHFNRRVPNGTEVLALRSHEYVLGRTAEVEALPMPEVAAAGRSPTYSQLVARLEAIDGEAQAFTEYDPHVAHDDTFRRIVRLARGEETP